MPTPSEILNGLAAIAESWRPLAILWHAYMGGFAAALVLGWRPSKRLAGALLVVPVACVGALAWLGGNPFNGATFGLLSLILVVIIRVLDAQPVAPASAPWLAAGMLLFAFGWVYPHFLDAASAYVYLYAAPLGLVPCPTLAMAVGVSIALRGLDSSAWSVALAVAGLFYGVFGALYLSVGIDWILAGGALVLGVSRVHAVVNGDGGNKN